MDVARSIQESFFFAPPLDTMHDTYDHQTKPRVLYLGAPKHTSRSIRNEYAESFDIDVSGGGHASPSVFVGSGNKGKGEKTKQSCVDTGCVDTSRTDRSVGSTRRIARTLYSCGLSTRTTAL